jgi:hypothetical protein
MQDAGREWLRAMGLPERDQAGEPSPHRFLDGARARVEIPSVEGPRVLEAVLEEAAQLECPLHRVSQGSGIQLLTDGEIEDMARLGRDAGIEVSLFIGPRAGFAPGAMHLAPNGGVVRPRLRGMDGLRAGLDDAARAYRLGIRSVLVADDGLLALLPELRAKGLWPQDLAVKVSVMMGAMNPVAIAHWAKQGIATYNVPTDLSIAELATVRALTGVPLDIYVEAPDDVGGFVRYPEIADFVAYTAPVYLKYGVRNAPPLYPSGRHLEAAAIQLGRERVRRARLGYEALLRLGLEGALSPLPCQATDLAVPQGGKRPPNRDGSRRV